MNFPIDIKIKLKPGWIDISRENPEGPATFIRENSSSPGVLQLSMTKYKGGKIPNPSYSDLVKLSTQTGKEKKFGKVTDTNSGDCVFGKYGFTTFSSKKIPFSRIWHLSNGKDFILVTYICSAKPDPKEIEEACEIVLSIRKRKFLLF